MGIRILLVCVRRVSRVAGVDAGKDRVVGRIDVAIGTRRTVVRNSERSMVEHRTQPGRGHPRGVAGDTGRRIRSRNVIRHVRSVCLRIGVIVLMAAVAVRGWIARRVVAADVAVGASVDHRPNRAGDCGARRQHVRPLQREACGGVVKLSVGPQHRVMTRRTHGSRKARSDVIRHATAIRRRAIPRRLMAPIAIGVRRSKVVVVANVAIRASDDLPGRLQLV